MESERRIVATLVIHGTFAAEERWWRLGGPGGDTFADGLEAELATRGMPGTVWRPVLDSGMSYEDFSWSGGNSDRARIEGARKLAESVGELAKRLDCTKVSPLEVNFVAHSHGGNTVLEALERLPRNVRVRRLCMLGTPLIWRFPAFRIWTFLLAVTLPVALVLFGIDLFAGTSLVLGETSVGLPPAVGAIVMLVYLSFYPWYLWGLVRSTGPAYRRIVGWWRRGGTDGQPAYGPNPEPLPRILDGPAYLLTSREDEADLILHFGASPREVYMALVKDRMQGPMRLIERLYVRPWFYVLGAPLLEASLEHFALGFSWRRVLQSDYEMVTFQPGEQRYSANQLERIDVTEELLPALLEKLQTRTPSFHTIAPPEHAEGDDRHVEALRATIQGLTRDLIDQVQLRHSVYYESDAVIEKVATLLVR